MSGGRTKLTGPHATSAPLSLPSLLASNASNSTPMLDASLFSTTPFLFASSFATGCAADDLRERGGGWWHRQVRAHVRLTHELCGVCEDFPAGGMVPMVVAVDDIFDRNLEARGELPL